MSLFLRILADDNKPDALSEVCAALRSGTADARAFEVSPESFLGLPARSFAYWVSENIRHIFLSFQKFENPSRLARQGLATADDFRFLRVTWELPPSLRSAENYIGFAKGGAYSPFYGDIYLWLRWRKRGAEIRNFIDPDTGKLLSRPQNTDLFGRAGLTWSLRTKSRLSMRVMPRGCAFGHKGPAAFVGGDDARKLMFCLALCQSAAFHNLVEVQLAAADARPGGAAHSFEVGVIQNTPVPNLDDATEVRLAELARRAWVLRRNVDAIEETSHAFLLPAALCAGLGDYGARAVEAELASIQAEIDAVAFDLYGFDEADRLAAQMRDRTAIEDPTSDDVSEDDSDDEGSVGFIDQTTGLLSWAVGVAFGRFDWRLATRKRSAPPEPDPFDPLPARSPGMLPDGAAPFHTHASILVDDPGHPHDLARLVEEVLARVENPVPLDVRRWLQRDFFPFHLQRYSKSRRKAPIYWPLSTVSGSYTIWLYYPSLTSQTLYTAVNDFIEPKLKLVLQDVTALRNKGSGRSRDEEKNFEALQALELELLELRDALLQIAPTYRPSHDDGVQITAAPLWPLFRHRSWQKLLKDTWAKLAKGHYDWSHLAVAYWPDRVREKCKADKSLAIAHGLEELYVEPQSNTANKRRGAK
ncbi:hypothetical protein J2R96_005864 [Bradyrhizobium elkanii]|nr:hypothetical protein [Bradyrhizobium elkanii]